MHTALTAEGPVLLVLTVVPTPGEVHPRATASTGPVEIADRFRVAAAAGGAVGTGTAQDTP